MLVNPASLNRILAASSAILVGAVALLTASAQAPRPPAAGNTVRLDVRAEDASGRLVRDLTVNDFRVAEDGKRQALTGVSLIDIPITSPKEAATAQSARNVSSNLEKEGSRSFILLIDDICFLETTHPGITKAQVAVARAFIERVPPGDLVGLATLSGRPEMARSLTTDRKLILDAIDRLRMDFWAPEGQVDPAITYKALAEYLSGARAGRKAIVALSPGFAMDRPTPMLFRLENVNSDHINRTQYLFGLVRALADGNTVPYVVDPFGGFFPSSEAVDVQKLKSNPRLPKSRDLERRTRLEASLEWTGGFAITGTDDYSPGFDRIVDDVSSYYMLDYTSSTQKADGKYRELRVEVAKPGVKVRTRSGYVAPKR